MEWVSEGKVETCSLSDRLVGDTVLKLPHPSGLCEKNTAFL